VGGWWRRSAAALGLGCLLMSGGAALRGADWPAFRGGAMQGLVTERGLPTKWDAKTGANVIWTAKLPKSDQPFSSPIVSNGKLFLTYTLAASREHHVLCLDPADGKTLWDTKIEPGPWKLTDLRGGYNAPTPAADGAHVFAVFGSAVVASLDFTGKVVWRKELDDHAFDVALGTSPVLYKDTVLLQCDLTDKKSSLLALRKDTGEIAYREPRPEVNFSHGTPALVEIGGANQLLVSASNRLQGVDPATGKVIWFCASKGDAVGPVYGGGLVYVDDGRGAPGMAVDPTGKGDVTATHIKWKYKESLPEGISTPLIVGDYIYRVTKPATVHCIELKTGKSMYEERIDGLSTWSSPVATPEGNVYFCNGGKSFVVKAGPTYELVATNDLGDANVGPSPAVAGGRIFIRGMMQLFCIGAK